MQSSDSGVHRSGWRQWQKNQEHLGLPGFSGAGHLLSHAKPSETSRNNSTAISRFWATRTANPFTVGETPTNAIFGFVPSWVTCAATFDPSSYLSRVERLPVAASPLKRTL